MILIAGATLVIQPARVVDLWLQSESRSGISIPSKALAYALAAAIKIALILNEAPLWTFAAVATAEAMLVALALAWSYRRWPGPASWNWKRGCAKELLRESWPFLLAALSIAIYMRIDQIMLRELAGDIELGYYSAVVPISQAWHVFPVALAASVLPRLSQLQRHDAELYELRLQQISTVLAWGGVAAAALTIIAAPFVVPLLLGAQFLPAVEVLQWHAVSNVFVALGVAHNLSMVSERAPRTALYKAMFGAAVSVSANILLIPRWGALGAAWSAVAAHLSSAMLSNIILAPRTFRMQVFAFLPIYRAPSSLSQ
jgi:O-antigen/teichoic acid export membrane protein